MIEHKFDNNTHIGGWYMPENICDDIIDYFNSNKSNHTKGLVGGYKPEESEKNDIGNHLEKKDSTDLHINPGFIEKPFNDYRKYLQECLDNYIKKYEWVNGNKRFNILEQYNIQYYKPNGGFKIWHFENPVFTKRLLVFMTFLNDVEDGGTHFLYQELTCPAKKGLTIIWPASWTHTHKGQISKTNEKYIVTGWYNLYE